MQMSILHIINLCANLSVLFCFSSINSVNPWDCQSVERRHIGSKTHWIAIFRVYGNVFPFPITGLKNRSGCAKAFAPISHNSMNETHIDGATSAGDAASFAAPSEITSVSFTASATHSGRGAGGGRIAAAVRPLPPGAGDLEADRDPEGAALLPCLRQTLRQRLTKGYSPPSPPWICRGVAGTWRAVCSPLFLQDPRPGRRLAAMLRGGKGSGKDGVCFCIRHRRSGRRYVPWAAASEAGARARPAFGAPYAHRAYELGCAIRPLPPLASQPLPASRRPHVHRRPHRPSQDDILMPPGAGGWGGRRSYAAPSEIASGILHSICLGGPGGAVGPSVVKCSGTSATFLIMLSTAWIERGPAIVPRSERKKSVDIDNINQLSSLLDPDTARLVGTAVRPPYANVRCRAVSSAPQQHQHVAMASALAPRPCRSQGSKGRKRLAG